MPDFVSLRAVTPELNVMHSEAREAVGKRYDPRLMQHARERSWAALKGIRERMRVGISEDEARVEAADVFRQLGMQRLWHPVLVRIGANTTKTYRQKSDTSVRLGENDSYFIDLGWCSTITKVMWAIRSSLATPPSN